MKTGSPETNRKNEGCLLLGRVCTSERGTLAFVENLLQLVEPLLWSDLHIWRVRERFEWALVKVMCVGVWRDCREAGERERDGWQELPVCPCLRSSFIWLGCSVLCAADRGPICCAPIPDGCCGVWAWCMGPGWLLGGLADSDREAGCWVMEFVPLESASHWQMLTPNGHRGEGSAHFLSLPPCGKARGKARHTRTHRHMDTVTRRKIGTRLICCRCEIRLR